MSLSLAPIRVREWGEIPCINAVSFPLSNLAPGIGANFVGAARLRHLVFDLGVTGVMADHSHRLEIKVMSAVGL